MTPNKVKRLRAQRDRLTRELEAALVECMLTCKHRRVLECDYRAFRHFESDPPIRVCSDCGFAEYGWSCGWQALSDRRVGTVSEATRDEVLATAATRPVSNGDLVRVGDETQFEVLYEAAVRKAVRG